MYDDILLAVDGSEGSERASEEAIDLAVTHEATLHVVSVVDATTMGVGTGAGSAAGQVLEALEREKEAAVDDVVERAEAADVPSIEASVLSGVPDSAVVEYAASRDVDLVVVGTHGRTGIEHVVLGSVAERVVRASDPPVLVVPTPES